MTLHGNPKEASAIKRKAHRFYYNAITWTIYYRSYNEILLRCLSHRGTRGTQGSSRWSCGTHQLGPKLENRLWRLGYYWLKMISDAITYARWWSRLLDSKWLHTSSTRLSSSNASSWPFEMWRMDVIGPINPPISKGHRFILAIINYFTKWAEVIPLKEVKTSDVIKFIKHHVIYHFDIPRRIVHEPQYVNDAFQKFYNKFRIQSVSQQHTIRLPTNKTIEKLLKKFILKSQCDWDEKLGEYL